MDTLALQDASTCLKTYRDRFGLNQGELADLLGVSQGLVSHWETRRLRVSPKMAKHIETITRRELTRPMLRPDLVCLLFFAFGSGHGALLRSNGRQPVFLNFRSLVMNSEQLPLALESKAPWQMTLAEFSQAYKPIRYFQRYTPEQHADRAASFRLGPVQREQVGEYGYAHPLLPDRAFPSPSRARRATHWHLIEQALRQGLPVPAAVLADYSPLLWKEFIQ